MLVTLFIHCNWMLSTGCGIEQREYIGDAVDTRGLLDCTRSIDIWVAWDNERLRFGRGILPGYHVLLDHPMNQSFIVQAIAFSSGWGSNAQFSLESDTGNHISFLILTKMLFNVEYRPPAL